MALLAMTMMPALPAFGRPRSVDVQQSKMTVHVSKRGLFGFLGDNHDIEGPIASGSYDGDTGTVDITVDAATLRVLDPKLPLKDRSDVQSNMLGTEVLDAARYPTIHFASKRAEVAGTRSEIEGDLTLHGQTHPLAVHVAKIDDQHFTGSAVIRQTAFGMTPIRVAGGAITVKDEVTVDFEIVLTP
ncbi:MAG TPA: YceI family protein [Candidatus Lustribacter sp.]|nr:YceI family protein [Candidatus Lustribacter sp.]